MFAVLSESELQGLKGRIQVDVPKVFLLTIHQELRELHKMALTPAE